MHKEIYVAGLTQRENSLPNFTSRTLGTCISFYPITHTTEPYASPVTQKKKMCFISSFLNYLNAL